jgi:acetyl/propionyl-CoA carboxylase alpha subunit
MVDEQMEKQQRTEFVQVLGTLMPQLSTMIQQEPKTAQFCGEILKFATAPYRAGRSLDGAIDDLIEQMKNRGDTQRADPEAEKLKALQQIEQQKLEQQKKKDETDAALKQEELAQKDRQHTAEQETQKQIKMIEMHAKTDDDAIRAQAQNQKQMADREKHQADMIKKQVDMQAAQQKAQLASEQVQMRRHEMAAKAQERQAMAQFKMSQPPGGQGP